MDTTFVPVREALVAASRTYMSDELGLSGVLGLQHGAELSAAEWVEFAHTPVLGHLGYWRLWLEAVRYTTACPNRALFVFVNDHLRSDARREIRQIRLHREERMIGRPIRLGVPKRMAHWPMCLLPPPAEEDLEKAAQDMRQTLLSASPARVGPKQKAELTRGIESLFAFLIEQRRGCKCYADWVVRSLVGLLRKSFEQLPPLAILPSRFLPTLMPDAVRRQIDALPLLAQIQNRHANSQGDWPERSRMHETSPEAFPGWIIDSHRRRLVEPPLVRTRADRCFVLTAAKQGELAPKVVLRQALANHAGFAVRFSGRKRGYQDACDEISGQVFGCRPPERIRITGNVAWVDRAGCDLRPSMLRALAETTPAELARSLLAVPPESDVAVSSHGPNRSSDD